MSQKSRRWVKVWHEIMNDAKFHDLSLDQQARWYSLLVYVSCHGDNGYAEIKAPARLLVYQMHCASFDEMTAKLGELVNVKIEQICNAKIGVTFFNWSKYQIDSTVSDRVKKHRERHSVTPQEKEKEKEKEKDTLPLFEFFWKTYPSRNGKKIGKNEALKFYQKLSDNERAACNIAVTNYAESSHVANGFSVDPVRFFKSKEYPNGLWREWEKAEDKNQPNKKDWKDF